MNLPNPIREGIVQLARKYGLSRVVLFGSRARGDNWERSDVDLAVAGGDVVRFSLDVDEELPTLLMFDVVNLDGPVQPELLEEIQRDGVSSKRWKISRRSRGRSLPMIRLRRRAWCRFSRYASSRHGRR